MRELYIDNVSSLSVALRYVAILHDSIGGSEERFESVGSLRCADCFANRFYSIRTAKCE